MTTVPTFTVFAIDASSHLTTILEIVMNRNNLVKKILVLLAGSLPVTAPAATVTWDGGAGDGLWITGDNWSGTPDNTAPLAGDTVNISNGDVVDANGLGSGNLPNSATITLSGNSTLTQTDAAIRLDGSTITVGAGSTLAGNFWDMNNGSLLLKDGANVTFADWENKGTNSFSFELGASGFSSLTVNRFFIGGGATIADATYNVDMATYTGGTGVITLVDYNLDFAGMDNTTFQGAGGLNVINSGGYTANLQWNDTFEAIELNVTAVPEPGSILMLGLAGLGLVTIRRRF